jgi:hypothetical protein
VRCRWGVASAGGFAALHELPLPLFIRLTPLTYIGMCDCARAGVLLQQSEVADAAAMCAAAGTWLVQVNTYFLLTSDLCFLIKPIALSVPVKCTYVQVCCCSSQK